MVTVKVPAAAGPVLGITGLVEKLHDANCGRLEQESVTGPLKPLMPTMPRLKTAGRPAWFCEVGMGAWPKLAPMWNGASNPEVPVRLLRVTASSSPAKTNPFVPHRRIVFTKDCRGMMKAPLAESVTVSNA